LLDRILDREPGSRAVAEKLVSFVDSPFPPVLLVEAMAQLAGIAAGGEKGAGGLLAAINHAEFAGTAHAGERLVISVTIARSFGPVHLVEGEVRVNDRTLSKATLTLSVGTLPEVP
jgi:3-hydroxyacyl-[acyl-carrier-protein] dehydratase